MSQNRVPILINTEKSQSGSVFGFNGFFYFDLLER